MQRLKTSLKILSRGPALLLASFSAYADNTASRYNMPQGVTPISRDIYGLHMTVFWICVAIGVVTFGVLLYTLIFHRKSRGVKPAGFHEHPALEITWAVVPFLILIVMAIPATRILIRMNDDSHSDITIKVTGYQWRWQYEYLDQGISFFSNLSTPQEQLTNQAPKGEHYLLEVDHPLVVPVHQKIRFLYTSNDVVHSWWVPAIGIKRDALPGFINEAWARIEKPGIYRGQCAELCGTNHGFMPIVVEAVSQEAFAQWVAQQKGKATVAPATAKTINLPKKEWTQNELIAQGKTIYSATCAACHKPDGSGLPGLYPALRASKIVATADPAAMVNTVLNGRPGTPMQAFGKQMSDEELAAVMTYVRNSWKDAVDAKNVVTPADISAARSKMQ